MKTLTTLLLTLLVLGGCVSNWEKFPPNATPMIIPDGYGEQTYDLTGDELVVYIPGKGEVTHKGEIFFYGGRGIASYEGEFVNNNWQGKGILTYENGNWIEAEWEHWNTRKKDTGGICYRADTGTFHELISYQSFHLIPYDGSYGICPEYEERLYRVGIDCQAQAIEDMACKGNTFTFNDMLMLPFKVAIGTVLVAGEIAGSPAGQAALSNQEAKNQRKREAAAYKKGRRDGIRKATRQKKNRCNGNPNIPGC